MKKKIINIVLSIFFLCLILTSIIILTKKNATSSGSIYITLVNEQKETTRKEISFKKGDTFYQLLEKNYDIEMKNGMLIKINDIYTDDTSKYFIKIIKNCTLSNRGVMSIEFADGDEFIFRYSSIEDFDNGC